jgi:hypothetical protein
MRSYTPHSLTPPLSTAQLTHLANSAIHTTKPSPSILKSTLKNNNTNIANNRNSRNRNQMMPYSKPQTPFIRSRPGHPLCADLRTASGMLGNVGNVQSKPRALIRRGAGFDQKQKIRRPQMRSLASKDEWDLITLHSCRDIFDAKYAVQKNSRDFVTPYGESPDVFRKDLDQNGESDLFFTQKFYSTLPQDANLNEQEKVESAESLEKEDESSGDDDNQKEAQILLNKKRNDQKWNRTYRLLTLRVTHNKDEKLKRKVQFSSTASQKCIKPIKFIESNDDITKLKETEASRMQIEIKVNLENNEIVNDTYKDIQIPGALQCKLENMEIKEQAKENEEKLSVLTVDLSDLLETTS